MQPTAVPSFLFAYSFGPRTIAQPESACSQTVASCVQIGLEGWTIATKTIKNIPKNTEAKQNFEMVSYWMSIIIQWGLNEVSPACPLQHCQESWYVSFKQMKPIHCMASLWFPLLNAMAISGTFCENRFHVYKGLMGV